MWFRQCRKKCHVNMKNIYIYCFLRALNTTRWVEFISKSQLLKYSVYLSFNYPSSRSPTPLQNIHCCLLFSERRIFTSPFYMLYIFFVFSQQMLRQTLWSVRNDSKHATSDISEPNRSSWNVEESNHNNI